MPIDPKKSRQMKRYWAQMSPEEREARVELLTGLWENETARRELSLTMTRIWANYKHSSSYTERLKALQALRKES